MRVVVTGAAGNVGLHVTQELLRQGMRVRAVDRQACPEELHGLPRLQWHQGSADDERLLEQVMDGSDAVAHLAAVPHPQDEDPLNMVATNVLSTFATLHAAAEAGITRVAVSSSMSIYGMAWTPHRFSPEYLPLDEGHPQRPHDPYAVTKQTDESMAAMMHRRHGMDLVCLRMPFTNSGEILRQRIQLDQAEPGGVGAKELWGWLDARDAARAFHRALTVPVHGYHALNVAAPTTTVETDTNELLARFHPDTQIRTAVSGPQGLIDTRRAERVLGFVPEHDWRDMWPDLAEAASAVAPR
ncbi:NAD(P)-dependent oxidoreductase [Ruania alkalisoli]|uniref:NAD(P)-dependent oxidoreductase n=1 Tax=Ruania alkalisoli TaxID=2779775 RepID=A0A7M1SRK0_9MICO|nr:NAD(P)-dependent oxidoreductase [Ruania alkalisoli]QOR70209.1 NAD(P)-dependent oxidoreductase [Ruania alkalisoli]